MTVEEYRRLLRRQADKRANKYRKEKVNRQLLSSQRANKYRNKKVDGYDSVRERDRAQELKLLERAGRIGDLREQVPYVLLPARRNDTGYLERAVRYVADFVYVDLTTGQTVVEDTKGVRTRDYIIKRKLMLAVHGITIREI